MIEKCPLRAPKLCQHYKMQLRDLKGEKFLVSLIRVLSGFQRRPVSRGYSKNPVKEPWKEDDRESIQKLDKIERAFVNVFRNENSVQDDSCADQYGYPCFYKSLRSKACFTDPKK